MMWLCLLKYKLPVLLLFIIASGNGLTQTIPTADETVKNGAFFELGGNGLWYSVNYDRIIRSKEKTALALRAGFAYLGDLGDTNTITIPTSISFLLKKRKKNFWELGGGPMLLHSFREDITGIGAFGIIGFRHQSLTEKGITYRIFLAPFIGEYSTDKGYWNWVGTPWGGLSLGYAF